MFFYRYIPVKSALRRFKKLIHRSIIFILQKCKINIIKIINKRIRKYNSKFENTLTLLKYKYEYRIKYILNERYNKYRYAIDEI